MATCSSRVMGVNRTFSTALSMKLILLLGLLLNVQFAQATHLTGGYIQAKAVSASSLTYEVTVVLYLNESVGAVAASNLDNITLCFGDGSTGTVYRSSRTYLPDKKFSIDIYRGIHTYPGPGVYNLLTVLSNRSVCRNITLADNLLFTLSTTFIINTSLLNQTPTPGFLQNGFLLGVNQKAIVALAATDSQGDSLVYSLAKPFTSLSNSTCSGQIVTSYQFPNDVTQKGTYKLNSRTGELIWDAPTTEGNYSVSLKISEYRNGILISETMQEILFTVVDLPGTPSTIPPYEPARIGTTIVTALSPTEDAQVQLTVFPNPVDDQLQVVIQTSNPVTATVQLLDANGRRLHELTFGQSARRHEQIISLNSLTPGMYIVEANIGGRSLQQKVVKR